MSVLEDDDCLDDKVILELYSEGSRTTVWNNFLTHHIGNRPFLYFSML